MRVWQVVRTVCRLVVRRGRGDRLRHDLEALGGAWVKFGQMLSTRYDLLPADVCEALQPLQGRIPGVGGDYARTVVTRELGSMAAFASFEDAPVAAATVGQVHRATLTSGKRVAVKILRPDIQAIYLADLRLLALLARVVDLFVPRLRMRDLITELRSVVAEEIDLRFEADHLRRMRPLLRKHGLRVPKVHRALCTASVLVCDWVNGTVMTDVLAKTDRAAWLTSQDLTGKRVARRLLQSLQRQVFEANRFHGDLHPGNLIVSRGRLTVIDFGSTSATERGFLDTFTAFVRALSGRDYARAADLYCLLCIWTPPSLMRKAKGVVIGEAGHSALRRQLVRVMADWSARADVAALPFSEKSINRLSTDLMTMILKAGGAMQWGWLRVTRAFSAMEGTLGVLWPRVNYLKEIRRYLRGASRREQAKPISLASVINMLTRLLDRIDEYGRIETSSLRMEGIAEGF